MYKLLSVSLAPKTPLSALKVLIDGSAHPPTLRQESLLSFSDNSIGACPEENETSKWRSLD